MRFIIILIALAVIVMVLKRLWLTPKRKKNGRIAFNRMVQCAHCGIYTPETDAILHGDKYYCSQAHVDAQHGDQH